MTERAIMKMLRNHRVECRSFYHGSRPCASELPQSTDSIKYLSLSALIIPHFITSHHLCYCMVKMKCT